MSRRNGRAGIVCAALAVCLTVGTTLPIPASAMIDLSAIRQTKPSVSVGDYVSFGSYRQSSSSTTKTAIEWQVLDVDGSKALLISRYCLDCVQFNSSQKEVKWDCSTVRQWLNDTFLYSAFSSDERSHIQETDIETKSNPYYGISGGSDTCDKVFLLSMDEAEKYFCNDEDRRANATSYAKAQGAQVYTQGAWWRLRSPGMFDYSVTSVYASGKISTDGDAVSDYGCAIRPAIWVDTSAID